MTPAEYIASLQVGPKAPRKMKIDNKRVRAMLANLYHVEGDELDRLAAKAVSEFSYVDSVVGEIKGKLSSDFRKWIESGGVAIGEVEDDAPNAHTVALDTGYAIVINSGLHKFAYRIARIVATRAVAPNSPASQEIREVARLIAEAFWWLQETGRASSSDYAIADAQLLFASQLTDRATVFLLCHEIGHVIRTESLKVQAVMVRRAGEEDELYIPRPPENEEHDADLLGASLAMGFDADDERPHPAHGAVTPDAAMAYAGIEFVLQIYAVFERLGMPTGDTHPQASARLATIRSDFRGRCASEEVWRALSSTSSQIERIFSAIGDIICDEGEHAQFFERQATELIEKLDQLLDMCESGGGLPNQIAFDFEASKIFSRGYPHKILERVGKVATEVYEIDPRSMTDQMIWHRIQRMKFLLNFVYHWVPEPRRHVFMEKLLSSGASLAKYFKVTDFDNIDDV